jgi:hypothetical protein
MSNISTKSHYVQTDGWRGYSEPINAIGGCNCTGDWSDSPCPTYVVLRELGDFKTILRKNKIRFKQYVSRTSNVFCVKIFILVNPEDKEKGLVLSKEYEKKEGVRLFYSV